MTDAFAIALGIVFLVVWVCLCVYVDSLRRVYTMGKTDTISHKNHKRDYHGIPLMAYNHGRRVQVRARRLKVHSTGSYRGYPTVRG